MQNYLKKGSYNQNDNWNGIHVTKVFYFLIFIRNITSF